MNSLFQRNLLALSSSDPELAGQLSRIRKEYDLPLITSRSGHTVPAPGGHPLHSRYDPVKEGEKLLSIHQGSGYILFLGLGGGYHIQPFLNSDKLSGALIIEKNLDLLYKIFNHLDLRRLLLDPRTKILVDNSPGEIKEWLLKNYIPVIGGNLKTVPLIGRTNQDKEYFTEVVQGIKALFGTIADDYTVQVQFGKKWFTNTILNLEKAEQSTAVLKSMKRILVTGAGPSLEDQIEEIRKLKTSSMLIATDTSLPSLMAYGIKPDIVISIDCQQISYLHFLKGLPRDVPLVLDLASPPVLTRLTNQLIFFTSGHPFSQYVTGNWRRFPDIDTSGGNVSHSALSLASLLGGEEIYLFGVDFSFPEGKTYSRNSYQYDYFRARENRTTPVESSFFTTIFKNKKVIKEQLPGGIRYTTKPMINYKERLEQSINRMEAKVIPARGKGIPLRINQLSLSAGERTLLAQGPSYSGWKEFLTEYKKGLEKLPPPVYPFAPYYNDLSNEDKDLWITLYPAAASFREFKSPEQRDSPGFLKETRLWTIKRLEQRLMD